MSSPVPPSRSARAFDLSSRRPDDVEKYLHVRLAQLGLPADIVTGLVTPGRLTRSRLVLAMATLNSGAEPHHYNRVILPCAGSIELVHRASVIVDDVQDGDRSRRGIPTAAEAIGTSKALALADLMLSTAFDWLRQLPEPEFLVDGLTTYARMAKGQSMDLDLLDTASVDFDEPASLKTGSLIGWCFNAGMKLSGQESLDVARATQVGEHLGTAFQLRNDVRDVLGLDTARRSAGSDLRQGVQSSVAIAYRRGNTNASQLSLGGAVEQVQSRIQWHVERANQLFTKLPAHIVGSALARVISDFDLASDLVADQAPDECPAGTVG